MSKTATKRYRTYELVTGTISEVVASGFTYEVASERVRDLMRVYGTDKGCEAAKQECRGASWPKWLAAKRKS
jgi:hypothetical protein